MHFIPSAMLLNISRIGALTCIGSDVLRGSVLNWPRILCESGEMSVFGVSKLVAEEELSPSPDL